MADTEARRYLFLLSSILQTIRGAVGKTFFVCKAGQTNGAHQDFVAKLKGIGLNKVESFEDCDYLLLFCPVTSRVGTDIGEALNKMPDGKQTVLVVMHHTFNPDCVVAKSSKLVNNPNILAVDCLFYDCHFLKCQSNDAAWLNVKKHLGVSSFQEFLFSWKIMGKLIRTWLRYPAFKWVFYGVLIVASCYKISNSIIIAISDVPWIMDL